MSRQINLYSSAFRRQPTRFSAVWTVVAVVVIVAGMSAYYAWETQQLKASRLRRGEAAAQVKQLQEQIAALGKTVAKTTNKALEEQVAHAEGLLKSRQELFARLQSGEIGNREGYAAFLAALARQHLDGVWLTGIEVSGPSSDFVLEGRTVRSDLLPGFIKLLRNEGALKGKPIGTLAMHERELDTKGEARPQGGAAAVVPMPGGAAGPAVPLTPPVPTGVRVVEFRIGTAAGTSAGPGGAGR